MRRYQRGGTEPSLDEVLCDPMVHLLMKRDRVDEDDLLHLIAVVRRGLAISSEAREGAERLCA
jgi:hypothetical protein